MRARVSVATLLSIVVLGACSPDTAIVLSIHAVETEAQQATRLEVYFGSGAVAPPESDTEFPAAWWRRAVIDPQTVALDPSLGTRTYELSLTPASGLALDAEVMFAVAAYDDSGDAAPRLIGFAHADDFLRFGEGQIRRVDVPLPDFDLEAKQAGVTDSGCAWWNDDARIGPAKNQIRDRAIVPLGDRDCDGFRADVAIGCQLAGDCNDLVPDINPDAVQDCSAVDTDCCPDSAADLTDDDRDGWRRCDGDCADDVGERDMFGATVAPAQIHPDQLDDTCNGVDEACARRDNGGCDAAVVDVDGDGYVTCHGESNAIGSVRQSSCERFNAPDCVEEGEVRGVAAADIHPEADDVACDGVDQNCDRQCDEGGPADGDGDGFRRCNNTGLVDVQDSQPICAAALADCDDTDPWRRPGVAEQCDGIDTGCDDVFSFASRPCATTGTGPDDCRLGSSICTETANGSPDFGACQVPVDIPLPDAACLACIGSDPLQCDDDRFSCGIHTVPPSGSVPCATPPQEVVLAPCGNCTWSIENGAQNNGWAVTLVTPGAATPPPGPQTTFTGEAVALRALAAGSAGQGFVVKRAEPNGTFTFQVIFLRHSPLTCGAVVCGG